MFELYRMLGTDHIDTLMREAASERLANQARRGRPRLHPWILRWLASWTSPDRRAGLRRPVVRPPLAPDLGAARDC